MTPLTTFVQIIVQLVIMGAAVTVHIADKKVQYLINSCEQLLQQTTASHHCFF